MIKSAAIQNTYSLFNIHSAITDYNLLLNHIHACKHSTQEHMCYWSEQILANYKTYIYKQHI